MNEEMDLLLKDLSARLPYGVKCEYIYHREDADYENPFGKFEERFGTVEGIDHISYDDGNIYVTIDGIQCELSCVKLYLRSMDSMSDDEERDYNHYCSYACDAVVSSMLIDWLNAHHFDYLGLIKKGLAIETSEDMYKK